MKQILKKSVLPHLFWVVVIVYTFWIFSNSMTIGSASSSISEKTARFLLRFVNQAGFSISFDTFHFYVRKLAHFSEYALLGFLFILASHFHHLFNQAWPGFLLYGTLTPLTDEGIQLFTDGRSASLRDCLIDFSGYLTGSLCMYILILIIHDIHKRLHSAGTK